MSTPTPGAPGGPTETDRLIAATRDEARKTRTLLLWLLVGLPVIGLCIWGLVAIAGSSSSAPQTPDSANAPVIPSTTTSAYPPPNQAAIEKFTVTDTTMCTTIDDWYDTSDDKGPLNPADAPIYNGSILRTDKEDALAAYLASKGIIPTAVTADETSIGDACALHDGTSASSPDETVAAALSGTP